MVSLKKQSTGLLLAGGTFLVELKTVGIFQSNTARVVMTPLLGPL